MICNKKLIVENGRWHCPDCDVDEEGMIAWLNGAPSAPACQRHAKPKSKPAPKSKQAPKVGEDEK